VWSWPLTFI